MSADKLNDIWNFLKNIEQGHQKKSDILSFAGIWKDLDQEFIDDLTINLHQKRSRDIRRFQ